MATSKHFYSVNIREFLAQEKIGEHKLLDLFSVFSCPQNIDVENFLKRNSIEFTKKNQSVTYLVFPTDEILPVGYFTITVKPLTINITDIDSNTQRKKIERVCRLDTISQTYTMSAYLIAQLGKNFTNELNKKISGKELLNTALDIVKKMQYLAGGMITFVETENNTKLTHFYQQNNFHMLEKRFENTHNELLQLFRLL